MPLPPTFETSRLTLVPAREADHLDALWAHWAQRDVRRYLFDDETVTRQRAADALACCLADTASGLGLWIIGRRAEPGLIGSIGLVKGLTGHASVPNLKFATLTGSAASRTSNSKSTLESISSGAALIPKFAQRPPSRAREFRNRDTSLGGKIEVIFSLSPDQWGHGYAHEALTAVVAYGFGSLALPDIVAVSDVPNAASHRLLKRAGFDPTGEIQGPRYRMATFLLKRK
jgi:RimJ/RimL family protein N-acetyltransferase